VRGGPTLLPSPRSPRPILRALSTATPWPKGGATDGGAKRYHHTSLTAFVPNDCDFGGSEGAEITRRIRSSERCKTSSGPFCEST
jgi:hypothetical protein